MTNTTTARVAVFTQPKQPFDLQEVELLPSKAGELIVAVDLCTICGSDLHTIEGRRPLAGPMVLGHEIIGRVSQLPDQELTDIDGLPLRVGDRITWSLHACCGSCFWCLNQLSQKCDRLFKYGHEPCTKAYPSTGGFGTHCQLRPGTSMVRIPDTMSDLVACPANCATATVAAAFRQVPEKCHGRVVLIFGAGMLGLTAAAMACEAGAASVIVVEPQPSRAAQGLQFGATAVANDLAAAEQQVLLETDGRGADVAFDFSGHQDAVLAAIHFLRIGGIAVLVGSVFPTESISLSPELIVRRWLRICGVHNYLAQDLSAAITFLHRNGDKYPFESLVSATYPLDQIDQAVRHAASGESIRVAVGTR